MATKYVDQDAYPAYAATPTWGVPQDGDGATLAISTASAVATIDCTSITSGGGAIQIAGSANIAVTSGQTGSTLADTIVTAINASTNTIVALATNWATPQVRHWCYARRTGNVVEIMTRAGSNQFNTDVTSACRIAFTGTWTGDTTAATVQFGAGSNQRGASGCWNCIINGSNHAAMQYSAYGYGVIKGNCLAGPKLIEGDQLVARANDKIIEFNNTTVDHVSIFDMLVDNADAYWSGTTGKKLTFSMVAASGGSVDWRMNYGRYSFRSIAPYGLVFHSAATFSGSTFTFQLGFFNGVGSIYYENVRFHEAGVRSTMNPAGNDYGGGSKNFTFYRCEFKLSRANNPYGIGGTASNTGSHGGTYTIIVDDCDVVHDSMTAAHTGFIAVSTGHYRITNSRLTSAAITPPFGSGGTNSGAAACVCYAENLSGFTIPTSTIGFAGLYSHPITSAEQSVAVLQNIGPQKAYRYESNTQVIDWIPGAGYPTLNATQPDGTPWSWRTYWLSGSYAHSKGAMSTSVVVQQRAPTDADAVRTITMELLLDNAVAGSVTNAKLCMDIAYTDSSGAMRTQSTRVADWFTAAGSAISASSASWTKNSYAASHSAYKLELTTAYDVKAGTDVIAKLVYLAPCPVTGSNVFVEPVLGIA